MKQSLMIVFLTCSVLFMQSQTISRSVIGSAGNVTSAGGIMLSNTVGEVFTQTLSNGNYKITQGFQQGEKTDSTMLYLLLYLEGYYAGNYYMQPTLNNQQQSISTTITDTITVELHPVSNPGIVATQVKTVLYTNSNANCMIPVDNGDYYIVIKHRNHLETWSAVPVSFTGTYTYHDFTWAANQAFGSNMKEIEPGYWAIYSGDINQDGAIDAFDYIILDPDVINGSSGYLYTDLTGDGTVDAFDYILLDSHVVQGVGVIKP